MMTTNMDHTELAKKIAFQLRKQGYSYDQTKHLFVLARKYADLHPPQRRKAQIKRLTVEQLQQFLTAAHHKSPQVGLMMRTLFEGAFRVQEFVDLRVNDFSYTERKLFVRDGKGGKSREVGLSTPLSEMLSLYIQDAPPGRSLFITQLHRAYSARRMQQLVKELADDLDFPVPMHPHVLRHTRATLLAEKGMPLPHLSGFLGHKRLETTQVYTRHANYDFAQKLDEIEPNPPM